MNAVNVTPVLRTIRKEIQRLKEAETVISDLNLSRRKGPGSAHSGPRHLTASARHRISVAQKARWAKWQQKNGTKKKNGMRVVGGRKVAA